MIKQTNAQALGVKGEQWFAAQLPKHWIPQKPTYDLGVDLTVVISEQNEFNGLEFRVQIKSSATWKREGEAIVLGGIKRATARSWAAGVSPTLLAFYDESLHDGFCAWALDALPDIRDLIHGKSETVSIKAASPMQIGPECWIVIRNDLGSAIRRHSDAVKTGTIANIVFPQIRDISRCLQLLHVAEFNPAPANIDQQMLLSLGQSVAHRDIVLATLKILGELDSRCLFARQLRSTIESYKGRVSEFYSGFDDLVQRPDENVAFYENPEKAKTLRPEMIQRATELLVLLATLGTDDSRSQ